MPPNEKTLIAEIKSEIKSVYDNPAERDSLTVRYIRNRLEARLGLEDGFFQQGAWKDKSKTLIKDYATELLDQDAAEEEETSIEVKPKKEKQSTPKTKVKAETPVRKGTKRESGPAKGRTAKRQKKEETPSDEDTPFENNEDLKPPTTTDSEASEFGDTEDSDAPKKKGKAKAKAKTPVKRQRKSNAKVESDHEDTEESDAPNPKKKVKAKTQSKAPVKQQAKTKTKIEDSGDESSLSDPPLTKDEDSDESSEKKPATKKRKVSKVESEGEDIKPVKGADKAPTPASAKRHTPKKAAVKTEAHKDAFTKAPSSDDEKPDPKTSDNGERSESEMSVLKDEDDAPKPKKKRRSKSSPKPTSASTKSKAAKAPKAAVAAKDLSPDEVTLKTLQSQLKKCGMNKIWQFELKQYGDDAKAKIKHLQKALRDIGMTGRFSEARAREIKEMRELQADVEAVQEGQKNWGLESGRASRSAAAKKGAGGKKEEKKKKGLKEESESEDEEGEDEGKKDTGSRSHSEEPVPQRPNARAGLAFLSDDSDE